MVRLSDNQKEGLSSHMIKKFKKLEPTDRKTIDNMVGFIKQGKRFNTARDEAVKLSKPKTYVPKGLSKKDEKAQIKSIVEKTDRPKLKSFTSKKSNWVEKFEEKYKVKITNKSWIDTNLLKTKGQTEIIDKGMGAYYSSGSRPNQTPFSWGYGRLASVIMGGPARRIDKKIWNKYKK